MLENRSIIISRDGSHTLFHPELNETYHSTHGAIQESTYVYIDQGLTLFSGNKEVHIIEVGLGTGLNALLTWNYAEKYKVKIYYHTLEPFPLANELIAELNYPDLMEESVSAERFKNIHEADWGKNVVLSEYFVMCKNNVKLEEENLSPATYDLCYFDAFAPSKQAEIWSLENITRIFTSLKQNGILVTYCAQGEFKRTLKTVGFEVEILPGPPFKKEMTRGRKI